MKKLLILIISCILISLLGGIVWYLKKPNSLNNTEISTYNTNISVPPGKLKLTDGSMIPVPQFIINNEATTTLDSDVFRNIAGDDNSRYRITYLPYNKQNSQIEFAIILKAAPLSNTRRDAESVLGLKLGVTNEELCKMEVNVYVPDTIAPEYAGQNLGLSFCDNAIELP